MLFWLCDLVTETNVVVDMNHDCRGAFIVAWLFNRKMATPLAHITGVADSPFGWSSPVHNHLNLRVCSVLKHVMCVYMHIQ